MNYKSQSRQEIKRDKTMSLSILDQSVSKTQMKSISSSQQPLTKLIRHAETLLRNCTPVTTPSILLVIRRSLSTLQSSLLTCATKLKDLRSAVSDSSEPQQTSLLNSVNKSQRVFSSTCKTSSIQSSSKRWTKRPIVSLPSMLLTELIEKSIFDCSDLILRTQLISS